MIGIIGYGSLIWDLDDLAAHVDQPWHRRAGPPLPVEFCRISPKRKLGLVLAIEPDLPFVPTSIINSTRTKISAAIEDLAKRERAPIERIGFCHADGTYRSRYETLAHQVMDWLRTAPYSGVVWTDLEANFSDYYDNKFSYLGALSHLKNLHHDQLEEAWRYITFAPAETATPFRRFLMDDPWWQSLVFDDISQQERN